MIIAQQQNDIVKSGFDNSKKATINQDKLAKLQYLLTKGLYSDPISAVVVEWTNNAVDAIVQAGKNPIENPVIVTIADNKFSVKDCGVGLNKEEFETVCMSYLSSTKEETNDQIGAFGIGMKSFMSLDRAATFTCIKDGYMWKFLAYQGVEFMEYDLIFEGNTTEENGVECSIALNGWSEFIRFKDKAKTKLAYYDTVVLNINGSIVNNNILRSEKWQFSNQNEEDTLHLCLKDVFYKIDYSKLDIKPINIPIALRFNLNEGLQPTPSRESLIWNTHTINLVKERIKDIANWFVNRYNQEWKEYDTFKEAYHEIYNTNKEIIIADQLFTFNDLLPYSDVTPLELKIKGIDIETPRYYRDLCSSMLEEYETLVHYKKGKWNVKYVKDNHGISELISGNKHIQVDKIPTGKVKRYLLEKYKGDIFFVKKVKTRKLGSIKNSLSNFNELNYTYLLDLATRHPKSEWRNRILEFQYVQNQLTSLFIQETNVESSQEYQEWLVKDKEYQKANRNNYSYNSKSNYKRINKQAGDITIQLGIPKEKGEGCKFVKKAVKITDLNKLHKSSKALHIYFTEDQKEKASEYWNLLNSRYSVCIISKNEIKKLPKIKNFMKEEEFLQSRPFCKIMTSLKYEKALDNYNEVYRNSKSDIVDNVLNKFKEQKSILYNYVRVNGKSIPNNLLDSLKEIAELKGLYDHSLDDVYAEFVKNTDKYNFISCLKKPNSWETEEVAKYNKLINSLLLLKKKYNNFEELDIEVKEKPIEVINIGEETILEEQLETA